MDRDNVERYYILLNKYLQLNSFTFRENQKVCGLCFETNCNHNVEKIPGGEASGEVSYWADVVKMELWQQGLLYDNEDIYPKWVKPYGKITTERKYFMYSLGPITQVDGTYKTNKQPFARFEAGFWEPIQSKTVIRNGEIPAVNNRLILIPTKTLSHPEFFETAVVI